MLRELNEVEMEMVSGGDLIPFNPFLNPISSVEEQHEAALRFSRFLGLGDGGLASDNIASASTSNPVISGPWGDGHVVATCCPPSVEVHLIEIDIDAARIVRFMASCMPGPSNVCGEHGVFGDVTP